MSHIFVNALMAVRGSRTLFQKASRANLAKLKSPAQVGTTSHRQPCGKAPTQGGRHGLDLNSELVFMCFRSKAESATRIQDRQGSMVVVPV